VAAGAVGAVLALAGQIGASLLLFSGSGVLRAASALLALTLAALAAGVWSVKPGSAGAVAPPSGRWWLAAALAMAVAGAFASWWLHALAAREQALPHALAVIALLGVPAYALGVLMATLQARARAEAGTSVALPALAGAALASAAGAALVPRVGGVLLLFDSALFLGLVGATESRAGAGPVPERESQEEGSREMDDKVYVITGVGKPGQVGYALARAFLAAGGRVVLTNIHGSVLELASSLAAELHAEERVAAATADLTRGYEASRVIELARDRFGRVDGVINVAGGLSVIKPASETSDEEWRREMERNAQTAFMVSREALPALRRTRGAIVNFAAPAGFRGAARLAAYSAAKAAVIALTRAMAVEEAPNGVRVNAIAPGLVDTAQNRSSMANKPDAKWVSRDQIVQVVQFLLSDAASGITGETIRVLGDGIE
jgi:NAD(P)-dependent dehydrogenase (short-subunit alcohol dehydrogenase family)